MWLFSTKPKPQTAMDRRQSLSGVPVRHESVTVETREDDTDLLHVRSRRGNGWLARFQPPVMTRNVKLDELGTFVFRLVDGKRTAREIVDAFAAHYRVNRREAELSCVQFLRTLTSRSVISVIFK